MIQVLALSGLLKNAATTRLNYEEMFGKLDRIAAPQNAASSDSNNTAQNTIARMLPVYGADGVLVMYDLPDNAGTYADMNDNYPGAGSFSVGRLESPTGSVRRIYSGSPNYAPSDEGVDMNSPDESLLMRGRDSGV